MSTTFEGAELTTFEGADLTTEPTTEHNTEDYESDEDNDHVHWAPPADVFSEDDPKHVAVRNLRMVIKNFLEPGSAETLNQLANYIAEDFNAGFSTQCQCGCYDRSTVLDAFDNADLESLKYIVEHKLLHPAMLCAILAKIFSSAGTLASSWRLAHVLKLAGKDFDKEYRGICDDWVNLADANIEYLLTYLCTNHAELVKVWRKKPFVKSQSKSNPQNAQEKDEDLKDDEQQNTPTLLHCVFYGHASDETQKRWVQMLLDVGCDPFAYYNYEAKCYDTPFRYMLTNLYYDMAMQTSLEKTPEKLRILVNLIDDSELKYDQENLLMRILVRYRYTKKPEWVLELLAVIDLVFKLGIDVTHVDKYKRNITDYIMQYGYADLLKERLPMYNLPSATKNAKPKWFKDRKHNVSPFATLLYKYRMAKSTEELAAFHVEYAALIAAHGTLTEEQLEDTGQCHEYESLATLMHSWGFKSIL